MEGSGPRDESEGFVPISRDTIEMAEDFADDQFDEIIEFVRPHLSNHDTDLYVASELLPLALRVIDAIFTEGADTNLANM
jgi:hypothetical protein